MAQDKVSVVTIATIWIFVAICGGKIEADDNLDTTFKSEPPPECFDLPLPDGVVEWREEVKDKIVDIIWSFGNETCSSSHQCYGTSTEPDLPLGPQMKPVFIQKGTDLRFKASHNMDSPLEMIVFKVDQPGFENCDGRNGTALSTNFTQQDITIQTSKFKEGTYYFIAETPSPLHRCEYGLKVVVIVRNKKCSGIGEPVDCWKKGRCTANQTQSNFACSCCHGFTGQYCGYQDGCYKNPCQNNGTCFALGEDSRGAVYKCICSSGYYGDNCENEVQSMCEVNQCRHGGSCQGNKTHYFCHCQHGYTGHHCEVDENDCLSAPCINGICVDKPGGYQCYCTPGFGGRRCEMQYNLCEVNPCKNHGVCVQGETQFSCQCPRGYKGQDCSLKVDLCNPSPCVHAEECVDFGHSLGCTCQPGYTGAHCEVDINECESDPCHNGGKCVDMNASYRCICKHGVHGSHCEFASHQLFEYRSRPEGGLSYGSPWKHRTKLQNLTLVAGTLGGAVVLALLVVGLCYCKVNESYKSFRFFKRAKGYKRHLNVESKRVIRQSSDALETRPSAEAIIEATTPAYRENTLNPPVERPLKSYKL